MKRWSRVLGMAAVLVLVVNGWTATAEPAVPTVTFTSAGDYAAGSNAAAVMNTIHTIDPDLHLTVGDLSYGVAGEEQAWCDFVTSRVGAGFPFELLAGNHESDGSNGSINDFAACLPNQIPGVIGTYGRQYYMDYPTVSPLVRFINISPDLDFGSGEVSYGAGTPGYVWTSAAIDDARAKGVPWVVVSMHKLCYSLGMYGCEIGTGLSNLLATKKVDLVLTGHDHLYQRTHQLGLSASCTAVVPNSFNNACVADNDNAYAKGAGTIWATVGMGGQVLRDVLTTDPEAGYFAASEGANKTPTWGVLEVSATADTLTGNFRRAAGSTTFADTFSVTAGAPPANVPPTAAFSQTCTNLACGFDANASDDSDGTITGYAWDFGDSTTGTGISPNHTFQAAGTYPVKLTVTDNDGATGTKTTNVVVTVGNVPPTASFTNSCTNLVCGFNAAASDDSDGTITGYAWDFGDSTTGTGISPNHTFQAAGTYPVKLTVTDNDGATGIRTNNVTVTAPGPVTVAADDFQRSVTGGWGTATQGGPWTLGGPSYFSVSGGEGVLSLNAGSGPTASLNSVSAANTDMLVTLAVNKIPTGGSGVHLSLVGRKTATGQFRVKVKVATTGAVTLTPIRTNSAGTETAIGTEIRVGTFVLQPGAKLKVRLQVTGATPTTVRARAWLASASEPSTWLTSVTDSTSGIQSAGSVGFVGYMSSATTNAPILITFDDLVVTVP